MLITLRSGFGQSKWPMIPFKLSGWRIADRSGLITNQSPMCSVCHCIGSNRSVAVIGMEMLSSILSEGLQVLSEKNIAIRSEFRAIFICFWWKSGIDCKARFVFRVPMFRKLLTLLVTCQPQELGNMATTFTKKARAHCREALPVSLCELVRLERAPATPGKCLVNFF
jgi:hypothetical protein